jgi:hypothetical protein
MDPLSTPNSTPSAAIRRDDRVIALPGFRTHGSGGGEGLSDGGPLWLRTIAPHADLSGVDIAVNAPIAPSIGAMVAHQTHHIGGLSTCCRDHPGRSMLRR